MTQPIKTATREEAQSAQEQATTVESIVKSAPEIPTVATLATIAAAMANPEEALETTAWRAMKLWRACQKVIERDIVETESESKKAEDLFLSDCGLNSFSLEPPNINMVPIEVFLKAISPGSRLETIMPKWERFWTKENEDPARRSSKYERYYISYILPGTPQSTIRYDSILMCREGFLRYLNEQKEESSRNSGILGPQAKQRYADAAAALGVTTTPAQKKILKNLKPDEVMEAICKFAAAKALLKGKATQEQKYLLTGMDLIQITKVNTFLNLSPKDANRLKTAIENARSRPPRGKTETR